MTNSISRTTPTPATLFESGKSLLPVAAFKESPIRYTESTSEKVMKLQKQSSSQFLELRSLIEDVILKVEPVVDHVKSTPQTAFMSQKICRVNRSLLTIKPTAQFNFYFPELQKAVHALRDNREFKVVVGEKFEPLPATTKLTSVFC